MSSLPKHRYSADEYLALDREANYKSEDVAGEIFAMGGASPRHVLIDGNAAREFGKRWGWTFSEIDDCRGNLVVPTLGIAIPLTEIYAKLEFLQDGDG